MRPTRPPAEALLIPTILILAIICVLSAPVGASTIIIDDSKYVSTNYNFGDVTGGHDQPLACIGFQNAKDLRAPFTIVAFGHITGPEGVYAGNYPVVLKQDGKIVGNGTESFQIFPHSPESSYVVLTVDDFDGTLVGNGQEVIMVGREEGLRFHTGYKTNYVYGAIDPPYAYAGFGYQFGSTYWRFGDAYTLNTRFDYKTSIEYVEEDSEPLIIDNISQTRIIDGKGYPAQSVLKGKSGTEYWNSSGTTPLNVKISANERPYTLTIYSETLERWYTYNLYESADTPITPTPTPAEDPTRTGTVTMTDHNGTSISGFEVTAVNHYTGEEYTVSTDTDVAVMNLPMDRTVEIRNPQTGAYEEAPVGYYRFYGQKPGYKMLYDGGIQVTVMPEKYGSYQLCDILVTPDSGPLTGKHQFQLRSWSDNSILQTGTISAKSATTGEWYNTTVSGGIATLILPYDTSNVVSQYAGNYEVYATSPGYEDIDYGVQITVYPRTVSEVRSIHLYPIGGIPTPGNVTLRIQAFSETGPGIPNAEIFIAGALGAGKDVWNTYTASSTGYLEVSVPGNSTYDIVARGAGYYDSSRRIEVFTEDPPIIEMRLYLSGAPTIEPTTEPTGWVTGPPTTHPTGGIPDEDDGSDGFLMEAVRGIGNAFGVGFATAKIILGMLLALAIGFATAKQLRGGAAEFGLGLLGGTMLGILVGLIPVWTIVVLLLVVGLYIGNRYVGGGGNNG